MAESDTLDVRWTPELEVALFHSMHGLKPVGLNKNFNMVCIQHKLQQSAGLFLTTEQIWQHLRTLYDLDSLENLEMFPFPNEERDFSLPALMIHERRPNVVETEGVDEFEGGTLKKSRSLHSSSLSPANSPISRKRKKN